MNRHKLLCNVLYEQQVAKSLSKRERWWRGCDPENPQGRTLVNQIIPLFKNLRVPIMRMLIKSKRSDLLRNIWALSLQVPGVNIGNWSFLSRLGDRGIGERSERTCPANRHAIQWHL